jgi:hypothetical protein
MPLGARIDLFVTWAFMSGLPIATTVWCTLAALQVRWSPWRLFFGTGNDKYQDQPKQLKEYQLAVQ